MNKTEKCKNCAHYRIFYRKSFFMFWKENIGFCSQSLTVADESGDCASFERTITQNAELLRALDIAIADVKALQKFYGED